MPSGGGYMLDIQSYLLRFGVWSVYLGGPSTEPQQGFGCLGKGIIIHLLSTSRTPQYILGGGFKYIFFHPYLGKISNLTNIFQMGWNHQPVYLHLQRTPKKPSPTSNFWCEFPRNPPLNSQVHVISSHVYPGAQWGWHMYLHLPPKLPSFVGK